MKLLRSLWSGVINVALVLLPWAIVTIVLLQYGQPLLTYFEGFLGNPVDEMAQLSEQLEGAPGRPPPLGQLARRFERINQRGTFPDTDAQRLRSAVLQIHRATLRSLGDPGQSGTFDSLRDTYSGFLESALVPPVSDRPDELRVLLASDLARVQGLYALPAHPARGLGTFLRSTDTAVEAVVHYGEQYAQPRRCRSLAGRSCEEFYRLSVRIGARHLTRYFNGWPQFTPSVPPGAVEFHDRFGGLVRGYEQLVGRVRGYLQAPPWDAFPELIQAHESFTDRFVRNVRLWYGEVLAHFTPSVSSFSRTRANPLDELRALRGIETRLQGVESVRAMLMTPSNRTRRSELMRRLGTLYEQVSAAARFSTEFRADTAALDALVTTLQVFPGGEELLEALNGRIGQLRSEHQRLVEAIEQRRYGSAHELLTDQLTRLSSPDTAGRRVMLVSLLRRYAPHLTDPEWQPTQPDRRSEFGDVIRAVGRLADRLGLERYGEAWMNRTMMAMKSRRFSELTHELERVFRSGEDAAWDTVARRFRQLQQLEELPGELETETAQLLYHTILLERVRRGRSVLFEQAGGIITDHPQRLQRWEQLQSILRPMESDTPVEQVLPELDLVAHVDRVDTWLRSFSPEDPMVGALRRELRTRLEQFLGRLRDQFLNRVRQNPDNPPLSKLLEASTPLQRGLERASTIGGVAVPPLSGDWRRVLLLRERLLRLETQARDLEKGSLTGTNRGFATFRRTLREFEPGPLPANYDPSHERSLLQDLHRLVIDRAVHIHREASRDILAGWGGRIRGRDVLRVWAQFLGTLTRNPTHPWLVEQAQRMIDEVHQLQDRWGR